MPSPMRPRLTWIRRHSLAVRITHWLNLICLTGLLMSGLQIFNATPALYWGAASDFAHPLLAMEAQPGADGQLKGITTVLGHSFTTTGFLGASAVAGMPTPRGFPSWATLPGPQWLAMGRRWHFFFAWLLVANGAVYVVNGLATGHFRRDLWPTADQLRHLPRTIREHARLHFPEGDEARHYNVLQKLAYLAVVFILLPLVVLAGMAMSPGLDSALPWLPELFGGRQSARTVHFLIAFTLLAFVLIHLLMVVLSGFWNNIRSMLTGRYAIKGPPHAAD